MAKTKSWTPYDHALLIAKFEAFYAAATDPKRQAELNGTLTSLRNRTAEELKVYSVRIGRRHADRSNVNKNVTSGELDTWFKLARGHVYPITKTDAGYLVTSLIRQDVGLVPTWPAFTKADAIEKVEQLLKWDLESRFDKGHGNFLEDIAKWTAMAEATVKMAA